MEKIFGVVCASLFLAGGAARVGGKIGPDGFTEIGCDLPAQLHLKNTGGSDGLGLCVFTSIAHGARWQQVSLLEDFRDWMRSRPGGGWPEKVDRMIFAIAAEKKQPVPEYLQLQGGRELFPVLRAALESGRMVQVTYSFSPTRRYGGAKIAHMVSLVGLTDRWAVILDNNYPGVDNYEWITIDQFAATFTGGRAGWAVVLLDNGPPPLPHN